MFLFSFYLSIYICLFSSSYILLLFLYLCLPLSTFFSLHSSLSNWFSLSLTTYLPLSISFNQAAFNFDLSLSLSNTSSLPFSSLFPSSSAVYSTVQPLYLVPFHSPAIHSFNSTIATTRSANYMKNNFKSCSISIDFRLSCARLACTLSPLSLRLCLILCLTLSLHAWLLFPLVGDHFSCVWIFSLHSSFFLRALWSAHAAAS